MKDKITDILEATFILAYETDTSVGQCRIAITYAVAESCHQYKQDAIIKASQQTEDHKLHVRGLRNLTGDEPDEEVEYFDEAEVELATHI